MARSGRQAAAASTEKKVADNVRAKGSLDNGVKAQLFDAGDDLSQLGIVKLAGNGGRDNGKHLAAALCAFL